MKQSIKTGVLSYGKSGSQFHCPFLELHSGFDLYAVLERTKKKAKLEYPNIISYDSIDAFLNDPEIELVIVNTPSATHFELGLKVIQSGKHVVMEKPFTVTLDEAKTLYEAAEKHNRLILPYQNRRYDSDYLSVKNVLESGKLGDLIEVHFRYDRYVYALSDNPSKESPVPGNGVLYNLGSHVIDAAISLFGDPIAWHKSSGQFRPNTLVDDYACVHLKYPSGLHVCITASLLVADPMPAFVLYGKNGAYVKERTDVQEDQIQAGIKPNDPLYGIEADDKEGILTYYENGINKVQEKIPSLRSTYLNIFEDVFQAIRNNKPYVVTKSQVLKQIEILE
ncbi:Gfo/Idh/MocA family oxidoreductase [Hyunsoonleella sp. SJ7]|uniref:Gfo/Idh/MocA family oxidoreductase n=1 Tax=Hyunsoonleella aquatilis TaxID=2762758 RepID=A0A923HB09_9FLAO|nr:Gfo/Idh/MocA family oxidoreductase [Hyunsoonleella aquatilis]MBC3759154.1 Gfo/Idh/MocA family oxidoreductase [Hyunsoonleella aquatilis]